MLCIGWIAPTFGFALKHGKGNRKPGGSYKQRGFEGARDVGAGRALKIVTALKTRKLLGAKAPWFSCSEEQVGISESF